MSKIQLDQKSFIDEFINAKALLKGHFILSSGLHSDTYMQCARVLMDTKRADRLCNALAKKLIAKMGENFADIVVAPAMGGVVIGYEMGRQLNLPTIFCERVEGKFELRRGFEIPQGARVLVVEDVITTGKSSLETFECIKSYGGKVVAECSLVDRSDDGVDINEVLGVPVTSLLNIDIKTFDKDNVPDELKGIAAIKPGSRFLKK